MMKYFFISIFLLFIITLSRAQTNIDRTITVDGKVRNYIIHLPAEYQNLKNIPMIFALHGSGGKDEGTEKFYQLDAPADTFGYLVIYPQGIYRNWNIPGMAAYGRYDSTADEVHFISALIDTVARQYKGDTTKVFLTGLSRGGKLSVYLAWKLNSRIRAIAPVCESIPRSMAAQYTFDKPIPVLLINCTGDPIENYNGGYGKYNTGTHTGAGFNLMPTEDLVKMFVHLNGCDTTPVITPIPDIDKTDGSTAVTYFYKSANAPVEFIKVTGGGHTWPGSKQYLPEFLIGTVCNDFSAAHVIIGFFNSILNKTAQ